MSTNHRRQNLLPPPTKPLKNSKGKIRQRITSTLFKNHFIHVLKISSVKISQKQQSYQNPGTGVRDHVQNVDVGMTKRLAEQPTAMLKEHKVRRVLADAENANQQIGNGQIAEEEIGDRTHGAVGDYHN